VSKRAAKDTQPLWRPNFNNPAKLPDIKVIRTNFAVNFVAVTLAFVFVFFAFKREYRAYSLGDDVEIMQGRVDASGPQDKAMQEMSAQFKAETASILDLEKFFNTPILAHEFMMGLSAVRSEDFVFNSIGFSETLHSKGKSLAVGYKLTLAGEVQDPLILEEFRQTLQAADFLQYETLDTYVDESLGGRDAGTGVFPYSIVVTLVPKGYTK
jgi:hypothetical protein